MDGATFAARWHHRGMPRSPASGVGPARLHHEKIARSDSHPAHWLLLTHGIYGAGSNWRGIARKLNERRPDWGVLLVDLRHHGRSESGGKPNDLEAAAGDLRALIDEVPVTAMAGHSFGGKVVLAARRLAPPDLRQTWMLDATPGARPDAEADPDNTVMRVLELLERSPRSWTRRDGFVEAMVAAGQTPALAQWLGMNLVAGEGGYVLRLDLGAIRELLHDYFAQDLWSVVEDPTLPGDVEIVIADRSPAVSDADQRRLADMPPHVHVHHVDAGHWLHIDAPSEVVELFARRLPE
ncbi:MAG: alpha/beta hydrolase fold protein [Myxococcales bacterium]|nr:alpha/beta hydrolase fold protein [Myxococcales bacterium]